MKKWIISGALVACLAVLVACGNEPAPPVQTVTEATAVATPLPVQTTAVLFTATPLPLPATVAPVATSTPLPPGTAVVLQTLADFGTNRNPLTGEVVADAGLLQQRPLAIKLSNSPPFYTRPQSGLNDADWIYEHTTEGAITRFTAIFYGQRPSRVGPIRSARLIDLELPAMYDAALVYSGSSSGVGERLRNADFQPRTISANEPGYYRTGEDKPFEHTLYGDPAVLHRSLAAKGQDGPPHWQTVNAFSSEPPPGGQPGGTVRVDYQWTTIDWRYDAVRGEYLRWADDEIHADGNSGEQVAVANVIIMTPHHTEDGNICEEVRDGVCAHLSVQIQLWGSGAATVLRDGQRYDVTWQRINRNDSLTFVDGNGRSFPLQIGHSWVQVMPDWLVSPVTFGE